MQPVRVDDGCYARLTSKSQDKGTPVPRGFDAAKPARTLYQGSGMGMQPREARVREDEAFDADLKRALEMSLEESKAPVGQGYIPSSQLHNQTAKTNGTDTNKPLPQPSKEEEDDPDLAAAIAASLSEMENEKQKHASAFASQSATLSTQNPNAFVVQARPEYELTEKEAENINLFATLVERLGHQPPGTILREPRIQELYEGIGKLRSKLARTFGESVSKHGEFSFFVFLPDVAVLCCLSDGRMECTDLKRLDTLLDLHSKLATVVRYYDRMLEDRLNKTYANQYAGYSAPSYSSMAPPPQSQASNPYPSLGAGGGGMSGATAPDYGAASGGGAESFYTGRPSAAPSDPYAQQHAPQPQQNYGGYTQQAPSGPYPSVPPQGQGQDQSFPPQPQPQQQIYPQHSGPQAYPSQPPPQHKAPSLHRAPSTQYAGSQASSSSPVQRRVSYSQGQQGVFPNQPPPPPQSDAAAGYYYQTSQPQPQTQAQMGMGQDGPPSPMQSYHQPPPQGQGVPPVPQGLPMSPPQGGYAGGGQGSAPYPTGAYGQPQPAAWGGGGGYPGMPAGPQQPPLQQGKVEEALIEL